jgi:L-iditol 2-dehydrogenase
MKKIVYYAPRDLRLEEMTEIPRAEDGGLVVKVEAASICGTDIKTYNVGNVRMVPGRTIGHEFVGRVAESRADGFAEGARVTMATTIGCGECHYCKQGKSNLCLTARPMGFFYDGAMADYVAVPAQAVREGNVVRVPDDIPAEVAAVSEPMSCAINGISRVPAENIGSALVVGLGCLGMLHSIALRSKGVGNIVCCDFSGAKKDMMDKLGFATVTPEELDEKYQALSDGLGFELVVITAPSNDVQAKAPAYARKGGYVSYFASLPPGSEFISVNSRTIHYNELVCYGTSDSTPAHVREAVRLLGEQQSVVRQVVTVLPFSEYMDGIRGVTEMRYAKAVLVPEGK